MLFSVRFIFRKRIELDVMNTLKNIIFYVGIFLF